MGPDARPGRVSSPPAARGKKVDGGNERRDEWSLVGDRVGRAEDVGELPRTEEWLIPETESTTRPTGVRKWAPRAARRKRVVEPGPAQSSPKSPRERLIQRLPRTERRVKDLDGRAREAEEPARRAEKELRRFQRRAEEAKQRVNQIERHVVDSTRGIEELVRGPSETPRRIKRNYRRDFSPESSKRRNLNAVGFDDLRELGLSITQSAQLLGARDVRRGFRSLDELESLSGFSADLVATLKRQLVLGE